MWGFKSASGSSSLSISPWQHLPKNPLQQQALGTALQAGSPAGLSPLPLGLPSGCLAPSSGLTADRRATVVQGCAAQGPCKAHVQAERGVPSPLGKAGRAQPEESPQQHPGEGGSAAPSCAKPVLSCRAGQAAPLCNHHRAQHGRISAGWQPRCPGDSQTPMWGLVSSQQ